MSIIQLNHILINIVILHMIYVYLIDWIMPLSAIFQLYHGDQVTAVEKSGVSRENHSMSATHVSN